MFFAHLNHLDKMYHLSPTRNILDSLYKHLSLKSFDILIFAKLTQAMEHTLSTLGPGEGGTSEREKIIIFPLNLWMPGMAAVTENIEWFMEGQAFLRSGHGHGELLRRREIPI